MRVPRVILATSLALALGVALTTPALAGTKAQNAATAITKAQAQLRHDWQLVHAQIDDYAHDKVTTALDDAISKKLSAVATQAVTEENGLFGELAAVNDAAQACIARTADAIACADFFDPFIEDIESELALTSEVYYKASNLTSLLIVYQGVVKVQGYLGDVNKLNDAVRAATATIKDSAAIVRAVDKYPPTATTPTSTTSTTTTTL